MSDIKVGDLVVIVKPMPCCGCPDSIGEIFRIGFFATLGGECTSCGREGWPEVGACETGSDEGVPISILKRIPPLDELERDEIVKELTA